MKQYTVYIIGDGPAACATSISLSQVLDGKHHNFNLVQVGEPKTSLPLVGETIPPAATPVLASLNLSNILANKAHLVCPGSMSQWGDDQAGFNDFFVTPIGQGYHLDRQLFNQQMVQAALQEGTTLLSDTKLVNLRANNKDWSLALQSADGLAQHQADYVVDATGIKASVARSIGVARNEYDSVVSLCGFYDLQQNSQQSDQTQSTQVQAAHTLVATEANGWWYGTQLAKSKALVSLCTDSACIKRLQLNDTRNWFRTLKQSQWFYQQCCAQFGQTLTEPNAIISRAAPSAILSQVIGDNWMAVGDAASSFDSFTSAGITKALQQGILAGRAIAEIILQQDQTLAKQYQQHLFDEFNRYLSLHQQIYHQEQRYADSGFWQRRQNLT